jgi:E3 ubiquitin-protein ligase RNF14
MANSEKQTEEISALQSIFDTKFRLLHGNDQYEISIDFDLNEPFHIRCNDKTAIIRHLPPFRLIIDYHDEYPSDYPPSFVLSCFYFSKTSLQNLCLKLDNYAFVKGEVCVFDWIELIKQEIIDELVFDKNLDEQINDPRALNGHLAENIDQIYRYLINYNNEREEKQFRNQLQTCLICTDMISGTDCIRLYRCGHFYCRLCLNNYVRLTFNNGLFGEQVHCPQNQCQKVLLPNEIKEILQDENLYERYERITLQRALQSMDDIIWCPRLVFVKNGNNYSLLTMLDLDVNLLFLWVVKMIH